MNNEHKEEYERTAGIQAPMPGEDDLPPTDSLTPAVLLFGILISIAFVAMLIWGFIVVFGTYGRI